MATKSASHYTFRIIGIFLVSVLIHSSSVFAQWTPTPNDTLTSYRIHANNQITFSIYAPNASTVKLGGTDIPNMDTVPEMARQDNGVWQVIVGPVPPGAYRYNFNVDGVAVIDPRNPATSEANMNTWSLIYVSGANFMDTQNVLHGAVAEVTYYSTSLERFRRMHIYTPPGYQSDAATYPVFYLLHGAYDCDDAWTTVGRAGFILDNLIASGDAEPMVVVMPAGHTGPFRSGGSFDVDPFIADFRQDIVPYVQANYRLHTDAAHTAIAGLSMGGYQTLDIAFLDLPKYGYIGVYSAGIFGIDEQPDAGTNWQKAHQTALTDPVARQNLELIWFAIGTDDFLLNTSRATVDFLRDHDFEVVSKETAGGHTWLNWREYLHEFGQLLFQPK